jgi:hypothetical protein
MRTVKFKLPAIPHIEDAIADVKAWGKVHGTEKVIILGKDGRRLADNCGDETRVEVPPVRRGFIVHCHPTINSPLSNPDLDCVDSLDSLGNLAVCVEDGTITWSSGRIGKDLVSQLIWGTTVYTPDTQRYAMNMIASHGDGLGNEVLSWYVLDKVLKAGLLKDLWVKPGTQCKGLKLARAAGVTLAPGNKPIGYVR